MKPAILICMLALYGCSNDTLVEQTKHDDDNDGYQTPVDCDDAHADTNPDAPELCDGRDNDCDGEIDEDATDPATFFADADGDGFGDEQTTTTGCALPDGYVEVSGDCDDSNLAISPAADELCNGVDDDCDADVDEPDAADATIWWADSDDDGYGGSQDSISSCNIPIGYAATNSDCNDADPAYNPGAEESDCADPNDYNCDGSVGFADNDGDGFAACQECDDTNAGRNPGETEVCDAADTDEDCDGLADDADTSTDPASQTDYRRDNDGDGYSDASTAATAQCEAPTGFVSITGDCDDANAAVSPAGTEICDPLDTDEDCDGLADDADASVDATTYSDAYQDDDGDGFGDDSAVYSSCGAPAGFVSVPGDCDDTSAGVNPGEIEVCDAADTDEDCSGLADDDDASVTGQSTWFTDSDGDGYGTDASAIVSCEAPASGVTEGGDCDDTDSAISPVAIEVCDGVTDEDCDGLIDDDDSGVSGAGTWYRDDDGDGYGGSTSATACEAPAGYISIGGDCSDGNTAINPAATELCDSVGTDEDCDGLVDDLDPGATGQATWFRDADTDGYGSAAVTTPACDAVAGYVANDDDCNDASAAISPAATEVCDAANTDEDCDGLADDLDGGATLKSSFYADADSDGYGNAAVGTSRCDATTGYVANDDDCNDVKSTINPAATEVCDAADTDEDCDGLADDADSSATGKYTWYADRDGDSYGDLATTYAACSAPTDAVGDSTDCNDSDATMNPGETEVCTDGVDNDCDGVIDCGAYEGDYSVSDSRFMGNYTKLYASTASDTFGEAMTAGDWDGDGMPELAVLADENDTYGTDYGTVFFYEGPFASGTFAASTAGRAYYGGTSTARVTDIENIPDIDGDGDDEILFWHSGSSAPYFHKGPLSTLGVIATGYSVVASGTNASGAGDFLSNSTTTDNWATGLRSGNSYYGAVYLYAGTTTSTNLKGEAYLDYFGESIAGGPDNDVDGDGFDDVFIGAPQEDTVGTSSGAIYVFTGSSTLSGTISASTGADNKIVGAAANDQFGLNVTMAGDADLDGDADVLVSCPYNDTVGSSSGMLYLFTSPLADSTTADAQATFVGTAANDTLGYDESAVLDIDGDGNMDLLANARYGDGITTNDGQIWIFYGPLVGTYDLSDSSDYDAMIYGQASGDYFGNAVVAIGDTDGDADSEFAVGALQNDYSTGALSSGAVWIYPGQ